MNDIDNPWDTENSSCAISRDIPKTIKPPNDFLISTPKSETGKIYRSFENPLKGKFVIAFSYITNDGLSMTLQQSGGSNLFSMVFSSDGYIYINAEKISKYTSNFDRNFTFLEKDKIQNW